MEIITRKEALEKGLKYYFTGKPCKHGHIDKRYTLNAVCQECIKMPEKREKYKKLKKEWKKKNKRKEKCGPCFHFTLWQRSLGLVDFVYLQIKEVIYNIPTCGDKGSRNKGKDKLVKGIHPSCNPGPHKDCKSRDQIVYWAGQL